MRLRGPTVFEEPNDGTDTQRVGARTAAGRLVYNTLPIDAPVDDVVAAIRMVERRRRAWDRLDARNKHAGTKDGR